MGGKIEDNLNMGSISSSWYRGNSVCRHAVLIPSTSSDITGSYPEFKTVGNRTDWSPDPI